MTSGIGSFGLARRVSPVQCGPKYRMPADEQFAEGIGAGWLRR